jgi:GT2 family glycosyltransferase
MDVATCGAPSYPKISVVVITRDRPRDLEVCLTAILASTLRDFELIVVDQSSVPDSAAFVQDLASRDPRVLLVKDNGKGAARARNIGTRASTGDLVVFTDDDCQPEPSWLLHMVKAMREDPQVTIVYGSVLAGPHNLRDGYIVTFKPRRRLRLQGKLSKLRDRAISANVAVRRDALMASGGFDEMLGPGGYFPCAEDFDLTYRLLARGCVVLYEPEACVVHHGLRDWQTGRALMFGTYVAISAAYMKHMRLGDPVGALLLLNEVMLVSANILRHIARLKGPFGFARLSGLLVGAWRSHELQIDQLYATYLPPGALTKTTFGPNPQSNREGSTVPYNWARSTTSTMSHHDTSSLE